MPITYDASTRRFHLTDGETFSRVLAVMEEPGGNPGLQEIYLGAALPEAAVSCVPQGFPPSASFDGYHQLAPFAYPTAGRGDFRPTACAVREPDGSCCPVLAYAGHAIYAGKPLLPGLPAVYIEAEDEATTLEIYLRDAKTGLEVTLRYTVLEAFHALACSVHFHNTGSETLLLERALSCALNPPGEWELLHLHGAWSRERQPERLAIPHATFTLRSNRGASGHEHNPFLALLSPTADERQGEVWGVSLVWSGSFVMEVNKDARDHVRLVAGLDPCDWRLKPGEDFHTPETVLVRSDCGLNGMSQRFHALYRRRLCRGPWRDRIRPLLVNNWEATYFDFTQDKLLTLAAKAKELGIELFVLDDGWFAHRDSDRGGLGDWEINYRKLPGGLKGFGEALNRMGLDFGLWIEPEMVSADSRLWAEHPDWVLGLPGERPHPGRHQYLLDMGNPAVVDYLYGRLEALLADAPVCYIKWDMNRSISDAWSRTTDPAAQGTVLHRYILGVYALYERLTARFPEILFESCASGGARFDPGMLYYAPQCWTSDDTDAVERLKIQYGTSMVYPVSSMGAHVSACPNHQLGRTTPLATRAAVALFGTFGYELDLNRLSAEECAQITRQVAFAKQWRQVVQFGTFWRLQSPFAGNEAAWMTVSPDRNTALVGVFRVLQEVNAGFRRVRLAGLDPDRLYRVTAPDGTARCHYGDELMQAGLVTSDGSCGENPTGEGDFLARLYRLEAVRPE